MKKTLLPVALAMATCLGASAQSMKFVPYTLNGTMTGTSVSENGKFVAGTDTEGRGFIHNTETGDTKFFQSPNLGSDTATDDDKTIIYSVTNEGVGVGCINTKATKFDFTTGSYTTLFENAEGEYAIAKSTSADGSIYCGVTYDDSYAQKPYIFTDGKKTALPTPTEEWIGFETNGYMANYIANDGKLIVGGAIDNFATYPLVFWVRNSDNSTYSVQTPSKRFIDPTFDLTGDQPYSYFEGAFVSENGKWIVLNMQGKTLESPMKIARFNVESEKIDTLYCPDASETKYYFASGIANDGTVVGYTDEQDGFVRNATICLADEKEVKYLADVYPTLTDIKTMDNEELNMASAISPDGRYIVGYGYYPINEKQDIIATWYIDRQGTTQKVDEITGKETSTKVVASYTADGKRLSGTTAQQRKLVIDRLANGNVVKRLRK